VIRVAAILSEGRDLVRRLRDIGRTFATQPKGVFETVDETIVAFRTAAINVRNKILKGGILRR
jgi:hypothetical protein